MTSVPPGWRVVTRIVYVPDAERAAYVRQPGEHVIGDAQIDGLARILGPATDRVVVARLDEKRRLGTITTDELEILHVLEQRVQP